MGPPESTMLLKVSVLI